MYNTRVSEITYSYDLFIIFILFLIYILKNRDRFRTMNNLIGDCYTVAIVQHLSKEELEQVKA